MKIDDQVVILLSNHPDIQNGSKGLVKSIFPDGVGVEFSQNFTDALGKVKKETRTVYFSNTQYRKA